MEPLKIWKTGEPCRIKCGGREVDGRIELASPCAKSLFITYDAILDPAGSIGGYVGGMPLLWNGKAYQDLNERGDVELEVPS